MRKSGVQSLLAGTMALGLAAGVSADRVIYRGEAASTAGIRLGGWGSGIAVDSPSENYTGSRSLRVSVDGYYSGGRVTFKNPIDLTEDVRNANAFLEFVIKFQPAQIRVARAGGLPGGVPGFDPGDIGGPGGPGMLGAGGFGAEGGGIPGAFGPGGFPGAFPGNPGAGPRVTPDTRRLRVVLVFDGAQAISYEHPLVTFPTADASWVRVALPFALFKSTARLPRFMLKELRIFGDSPDTFYVGEIRTVTDTDPIVIEPLDEQVVASGDQVTFNVTAESGLSVLKYSWDFDSSDGIQEDAVGKRVSHVYKTPSKESQPYVVTLTVTDMAGAKKAERLTTTVEVIE